mgnify:CR=1 FL=1
MNFYKFCVTVVRNILYVIIRFRAYGSENVPKEGAFLLCANHKSNIDPVLLAAGISRRLTFMAKDELFHVPLFGRLIRRLGAFPIKRGKGDAAAVMATLKILKRGEATVIFPEGKRMRRGERKEVNPGIIRLAIQAKVPIVPAFAGKHTVTYGKPIVYSADTDVRDGEKLRLLADELMDTIYGLQG